MFLSMYSQYVVSDPFERLGPTMVFSFMLIGRLVIFYQVGMDILKVYFRLSLAMFSTDFENLKSKIFSYVATLSHKLVRF